jgi:putative component of membrane protein insertase Oxa1/YidC/SpoIIIJ protein YidD
MRPFILAVLLIVVLPLHGEPWGKDADLARMASPLECEVPPRCKTFFVGQLAEALIDLHQNFISQCDGPRSHFIPSSSQYTLTAMRKYGFCRGLCMGCDRLMRENKEEWVYRKIKNGAGQQLKYNPVP